MGEGGGNMDPYKESVRKVMADGNETVQRKVWKQLSGADEAECADRGRRGRICQKRKRSSAIQLFSISHGWTTSIGHFLFTIFLKASNKQLNTWSTWILILGINPYSHEILA